MDARCKKGSGELWFVCLSVCSHTYLRSLSMISAHAACDCTAAWCSSDGCVIRCTHASLWMTSWLGAVTRDTLCLSSGTPQCIRRNHTVATSQRACSGPSVWLWLSVEYTTSVCSCTYFFTNYFHRRLFSFLMSDSTVSWLFSVLLRLFRFLFLVSYHYFSVMIQCGRFWAH